jgi:hypothetical protein
MQRVPTGVIRKIIVGPNPKDDGLSYQLGNFGKHLIITNILEDVNHFYLFGRIRYLIYVKEGIKAESKLWKALENVPVTIEYDLSGSEVIV